MKKIMMLFVTLFLAMCTGCTDSGTNIIQETEVKGGRETSVDESAPKEIKSTELIFMDCMFSTVDSPDVDEVEGVECGIYYLNCSLDPETGAVTGSYRFETLYEEDKNLEFEFSADADFMSELNDIIIDSKIVKFNGTFEKVNGIPPEFGYSFKAVYASGEKIDCWDNVTRWISLETAQKLNELFLKEME